MLSTRITSTRVGLIFLTSKSRMSYSPRGYLARLVVDKSRIDKTLDNCDMKKWYILPKIPQKYEDTFVDLKQPDEITLMWLKESKETSSKFWLQLWHLLAKTLLSVFMTQTDINGLLKRGSMFILSELQYQILLLKSGFHESGLDQALNIHVLDIGAGDGEVTMRFVKAITMIFPNIPMKLYATDSSWTMRSRLVEKQINVLEDINQLSNVNFISCLNVLDRCIDPHKILQDIYNALAPNGRLLVALVLPYNHYVEKNSSHMPLRPLMEHWRSSTWLPIEKEIEKFFEQLEYVGFKILSWTKAPYLCEGDFNQSFYWLDDIVVVCSK
ncbi:protein-L-histidine N-pros-methyltransferase [Toxorhynchites rutilus septentrionalis]|uniref:protein-L-histidine N-pros-methyltransferase n=1 Tax=Toxorhynchites rutilus septentrionalis TaxID=329112 RepID=UPI002479DB33|nr:protein-L-histidine N-pros-methyltransferase [Toxorhynchites rutilus septentrionalis]